MVERIFFTNNHLHSCDIVVELAPETKLIRNYCAKNVLPDCVFGEYLNHLVNIWEIDFKNIMSFQAIEINFVEFPPKNKPNESFKHQRLKYAAKNWLVEHGMADAKVECHIDGRIADASSVKGKTASSTCLTDMIWSCSAAPSFYFRHLRHLTNRF